jgi:rubrerythrin
MPTLQQFEHRAASGEVLVVQAAGQAPEDVALYVCQCGHHFTAAATTSVTCPSCGDGQAW